MVNAIGGGAGELCYVVRDDDTWHPDPDHDFLPLEMANYFCYNRDDDLHLYLLYEVVYPHNQEL